MNRVTRVEVKPGHSLEVELDGGIAGMIDLAPEFVYEAVRRNSVMVSPG